MPNNNESQQTDEQSPPTIQISLDYYISLACKGLDEIAVVSRAFGIHVQSQDPEELYCHVELGENPNLATIYRIASWKTCCRRDAERKRQSEVSRQLRFALEQEEAARKLKIQRKRDILQETIADIKKLHGYDVAIKLTKGEMGKAMTDLQRYDFFVSLVFKALIGEHAKAANKFQISAEIIKEFSDLPKDPEFKNRYISGLDKEAEI